MMGQIRCVGNQGRSVKLVGGSCGQETVVPLTGIRKFFFFFFLELISLYAGLGFVIVCFVYLSSCAAYSYLACQSPSNGGETCSDFDYRRIAV
jgi:hypothetical protein